MENRNNHCSPVRRMVDVQARFLRAELAAALCLCATGALAQIDMDWIRQQWLAHNYRAVIAPLKDYLDSLSDDAREFEPDYMMASSLTNLAEFHREGCQYFEAMVGWYDLGEQHSVGGSNVTIQSAMQKQCPQELRDLAPPPSKAGVSVSEIRILPKRKDVLKQVKTAPPAPQGYYRLQLKHGGRYLDATYCSNAIALNPGSDWENGACQLWRFVPAGQGYYRIQLKHGGQYLDATYCSSAIALNPGSDWENGACQLWRLVPAGDGYYRIQLKHGGQYLDAKYCSNAIALNPGSDWENGACQLWRLVPTNDQKID